MAASDAERTIKEFDYAIQRRREGVTDPSAMVGGFRKVLQADESRDGAPSERALKITRGLPCRRFKVPEEALRRSA